MKDACILCNIIEFFWQKKENQDKKRRAFVFETPNDIDTIMEEHIKLFVQTLKYLNY
jgi:hypothetical protein